MGVRLSSETLTDRSFSSKLYGACSRGGVGAYNRPVHTARVVSSSISDVSGGLISRVSAL